jgi:hypothetical protein
VKIKENELEKKKKSVKTKRIIRSGMGGKKKRVLQ